MKIVRWYKEIELVGLKDWWFFVVTLERDEFSNKLDLGRSCVKAIKSPERLKIAMQKVTLQRNRAHRIDIAIADFWRKQK